MGLNDEHKYELRFVTRLPAAAVSAAQIATYVYWQHKVGEKCASNKEPEENSG